MRFYYLLLDILQSYDMLKEKKKIIFFQFYFIFYYFLFEKMDEKK